MMRFLKHLLFGDPGQDLVEYTLLLAFVALASAGLFMSSGADINQIWSTSNSVLSTATAGTPASSGGGGGGNHGGDGGRH